MDLKQISAFVWVAELGSFSAAAEKMHTTQPTISQRIAALEATLDVRLFERSSARGIRLTDKGQELLPLAQRMVDTSHVLREQLSSRQIDLAFVVGASQDPRERSLHHHYAIQVLPEVA